MQQLTLARQAEFQRYTKKTRREQFLDEMEAATPWVELQVLVERHHSKGETGRKPWVSGSCFGFIFCNSGLRCRNPAWKMPCMSRRCCGALPEWTWAGPRRRTRRRSSTSATYSKKHDLCGEMLDAVNHYLESRGIRITTGTIVDATIVDAPSSTKNEKKERDREMHQTKKGNQWYFGMKAHIGVDSKEGIVHSVCSTAASVSDMHMSPELLHGGEKKVWGMRVIKDRPRRSAKPLPKRKI